MKVLVEASVPYIRGVIEEYAEVVYLDNNDITREAIRDVDAMLVRSITKCNEELLSGSAVQYIATATAGIDHIDQEYCDAHGLHYTNAPGCNAMAVAQYVFSSLSLLSLRYNLNLQEKTIGIVGVGHVGRLVEKIATAMGMKVLLCDPPRVDREGDQLPHRDHFVALSDIQSCCDIITLHVPLTKSGNYPTMGLVDDAFLDVCLCKPILINACRGAVTKTSSLIRAKKEGKISYLVLDCWEGEPYINEELLLLADIATPHIAGFSADGKHRGARMALLSIGEFFDLGIPTSLLEPKELQCPTQLIDLSTYEEGNAIAQAQLMTFNPSYIDMALRAEPAKFEYFRKNYDYPREMSAYGVIGGSGVLREVLSNIGFQLR